MDACLPPSTHWSTVLHSYLPSPPTPHPRPYLNPAPRFATDKAFESTQPSVLHRAEVVNGEWYVSVKVGGGKGEGEGEGVGEGGRG